MPEELVTDNMSALVSLSGGRRRRVERAWRFADEAGFRLVLCAPRSPETKDKDESANRFLSSWRPTRASSPAGRACAGASPG